MTMRGKPHVAKSSLVVDALQIINLMRQGRRTFVGKRLLQPIAFTFSDHNHLNALCCKCCLLGKKAAASAHPTRVFLKPLFAKQHVHRNLRHASAHGCGWKNMPTYTARVYIGLHATRLVTPFFFSLTARCCHQLGVDFWSVVQPLLQIWAPMQF